MGLSGESEMDLLRVFLLTHGRHCISLLLLSVTYFHILPLWGDFLLKITHTRTLSKGYSG